MSDKNYKILIIAGEASGDLHGSELVQSLTSLHPDCRFFGVGGNKMRQAGVQTFFDIERMGTVGVVEILGELPHFIGIYRTLAREIATGGYDAAILVDYPTLNLRLARLCKQAGCPVFYFISPQIWAWRKGRIKQIRQTVSRMFVVLPFEETLYKEAGVDAEFLGHPFADVVRPSMEKDEACESFGVDPEKKIIGLLPGSRKNEVQSLLPVMLAAAREIQNELADCQFLLPVADSIDPDLIRQQLSDSALNIRLVGGKAYDVMNCSDFLIIASGSATLEAGILGCPMVIVYKLKSLTYWLAKILVDAKVFGLVNIVAGEQVVPELLQGQVTAGNIAQEALGVLRDRDKQQAIRSRLIQVKASLGEAGVSGRVAKSISRYLDKLMKNEKISA